MKRSGVVISILAFGALCIAVADDLVKAPPKHKVAADFKACPDGHTALKDVPIVWGLVGPLYKKPADYNDEDRRLAERARKGEIVFGDDFSPLEDRADSRVVCQQCGFEYDPGPLKTAPQLAGWSKGGSKPSDFRIPFSKALLGFPLLEPVMGSLHYAQSFDAEGKVLKSEDVSFRTAWKMDAVLETARKWLSANDRDPKDLKQHSGTPANHEYKDNYLWLLIQDDAFWHPGQVNVLLYLSPLEAGKPKRMFDAKMISAPAPPAPGDPFASAPESKETGKPASPKTP